MSQADGVIDADILRAAAPVPVAGGATDTAVLPDPCDDALCRLIHARVEGFPGIEVLKRETRVVEAETLIEYAVLITDAGEVRLEAR